jgi:hypothetical protein
VVPTHVETSLVDSSNWEGLNGEGRGSYYYFSMLVKLEGRVSMPRPIICSSLLSYDHVHDDLIVVFGMVGRRLNKREGRFFSLMLMWLEGRVMAPRPFNFSSIWSSCHSFGVEPTSDKVD